MQLLTFRPQNRSPGFSGPPRAKKAAISNFQHLIVALELFGASWLVAGVAHAQPVEPGSEGEAPALEAGQLPVPPPPSDAALPEVEEIIPDAEFNEAVPTLDPFNDAELSEELESIEQFERRLEAEEAAAAGTVPDSPPLRDPALADGDPVEEIEDAPIRDAELVKPLPPIEAFEVTPVDFVEAEQDDETVEVAYRVELDGIDEADAESKADLRAMFGDLSALGDGDGKAANSAMIAARLTEDSELLKTILAAEGWYDPNVTTSIDLPTEEGGGPLVARIDVIPGTRYTFSDIVIVARPTVPPELITENLALKVGEPIVAERVQGSEAQISLALPEQGYPFAEVGDRDILLDPETGDGVYTLPVEIGPRSVFGGFVTEGDLAFDADHVGVLARFERGELYDSRLVDDLRKALVSTGLFSTIAVEPVATGEDAGDGTEYVMLDVLQDAGPPRTIAGSAGYSSGEGFRVEASWTHRNLFPPEGALTGFAIAGTKEQGLGVSLKRSNAGRRDRTVEIVAEALHSEFDAYSAYTGRLAGQVRYDSTPIWQKTFTHAYGFELLATAERDFDIDLGERRRRTYYIGGINGQFGIDKSNDLLDPTRGFRLTAFVRPEASFKDNFDFYVKSQLDASGYFPAGDSFVLAGRVRLGSIAGAPRRDIAPSRRFYAGGGGSVRGYAYQKLGPLDPNGDPIGGRSLNEASVEARYRFGNFGVVGFVDAGQSYASSAPKFSDLRYGAGLGVRYYTNFGPMRVDVATPINRRPGEGRINIYVSIGQAF